MPTVPVKSKPAVRRARRSKRKKNTGRERVARFDGLKPSSPIASAIKRKNTGKNTRAEILLRRQIWSHGVRYRLHAKELPGKPDIVFRKARVAVFCDGDFWHGRTLEQRRARLARGSNGEYWVSKIEGNVLRDSRQTKLLRREGWRVVRVWETDVIRNPDKAAARVVRLLRRERA